MIRKYFLYLADLMLSVFLPICFAMLAVAGFLLNSSQWLPRAILMILGLIVAWVSPRVGILVALATATWFHIPLLNLHYANQFIFEFYCIGTLLGIAVIRVATLGSIDRKDTQWLRLLSAHPFAILACFTMVASFIPILFQYGQLKVFAQGDWRSSKFIATLVARVFDWDVTGSTHSLAILMAYWLHICLLGAAVREVLLKQMDRAQVWRWIVYGSLLPFIFWLIQYYLPSAPPIFSSQFSLGFGGTFESGNHLSFYSALIVLFSLLLLNLEVVNYRRFVAGAIAVVWSWPLLSGVIQLASISPTLAGRGRTAMLGLVGALAVGTMFRALYHRRRWLKIFVALTFSILGLLIFVWQFENIRFAVWYSGRLDHFELAWQWFAENPLSGIGLGNFYVQSRSGYDIHNLYLALLCEMGILGLGVLLAAFALFGLATQRWLRTLADRKEFNIAGLNIAILAFFATAATLDNFQEYRYFLLLQNIWLATTMVPWLATIDWTKFRWLWKLVILAGLAVATFSLLAERTRPNFLQRSLGEHVEEFDQPISSSAGLFEIPWEGKECVQFAIRPMRPYSGNMAVMAAFSSSNQVLPTYQSLKSYLAWLKAPEFKTLSLENNRWNVKCLCISPPQLASVRAMCNRFDAKCQYLLASTTAVYQSFTDFRPNRDDRFLAFQINHPIVLSREEARKSIHQNLDFCDQLLDVTLLP